MSEHYNRVLDVVNRGFSGYNSRWAIPSLHQILANKKQREAGQIQKARLITIWFGANDAMLPSSTQHVPLDEYKENLTTIIQLLQSPTSDLYSPDTRIVLLTPGPTGAVSNPDRRPERPLMYAKACLEVGEAVGVPVLDVYKAIVQAAGGESDEDLAPYL